MSTAQRAWDSTRITQGHRLSRGAAAAAEGLLAVELHEIVLANLTRRMLHLGWHPARLARQSGLSDASLSRILAGKQTNLTLATVGRLAAALGMAPAALLTPPVRTASGSPGADGDMANASASSSLPLTLTDFLRVRHGYSPAYAEELAEDLEAIRLARDQRHQRRGRHQRTVHPAE